MTHDPLLRLLERLRRAEPDPSRGQRVRVRCHAALARRHVRRRPKRAVINAIWEPAPVVALCVAYLAQVVRVVVQLYGLP
jgi:hypothetical protein